MGSVNRARISSLSFTSQEFADDGKMNEDSMKSSSANRAGAIIWENDSPLSWDLG